MVIDAAVNGETRLPSRCDGAQSYGFDAIPAKGGFHFCWNCHGRIARICGRAVEDYMALNLIKLCVGCDSIEDLEGWISASAMAARDAGVDYEQVATTRMMPKRREELEGGSLYWVIKGQIACRQHILELRPFTDGQGIGRTHIVLEPTVIALKPRRHRAFQGWRYLEAAAAPEDLAGGAETGAMPEAMKRELAELGLL